MATRVTIFKAVLMPRFRVTPSKEPSSTMVRTLSNSSTPDDASKSFDTAGIFDTSVSARLDARTAGTATSKMSWLEMAGSMIALRSFVSSASNVTSTLENFPAMYSMNSMRRFVLAS